MSVSLSPRHLKRYLQVARLIARHWDRAPDGAMSPSSADLNGDGRALADDLEKMGPTFIKLGQLLSTRPDLAPPAVRKDLARLQDSVEPADFADVRALVEAELGARLSTAFQSFQEQPVGSASLAQVHAATLRDGREVVVKVQRPDVEDSVRTDLAIVRDVADWLENHTELEDRYGLSSGLRELAQSLSRELDYRLEARNLGRIRAIVGDYEHLVVPEVVEDFSTRRVITMDRVHGMNLGDLSPLARIEGDFLPVARDLFRAYLEQALVHGFVHADPHPGNLMVCTDGRLALVDLGMVAAVPAAMRDRLLRLVLALSEGEGSAAAQIAEGLGTPLNRFDPDAFRSAVARTLTLYPPSEGGRDLGALLVEITSISGEFGLRPDPSLTMLGKTLLNLEESGRLLAPDFRPDQEIRAYAPRLLLERGLEETTGTSALRKSLAAKDLAASLPGRVERILDRVEAGEFRIRFDLQGEERLVNSVTRVANRITEGIVLAALVVGAALLSGIETDLELLGYPGLAMILFLLAALGGVRVLWTIARDNEG
jgi:predicted unusual protein kinase regulating ubiquinone biosynthesis (AarF/ABC1/UbiB family)